MNGYFVTTPTMVVDAESCVGIVVVPVGDAAPRPHAVVTGVVGVQAGPLATTW